jgi:hypothetical protein
VAAIDDHQGDVTGFMWRVADIRDARLLADSGGSLAGDLIAIEAKALCHVDNLAAALELAAAGVVSGTAAIVRQAREKAGQE